MSLSPYLIKRKKHNISRDKARELRKQHAFDMAVKIEMGAIIPNWTLASDKSSITQHIEGKQDRTYSIKVSELRSKVAES